MKKQTVIVTGASSGIGFAAATLFAAKGYQTYGLSRRKIDGATFNQIQTDVNDDASVEAAVARIVKETGRVDVLFNNAGFAFVGATEESSISQVKAIFETNFFGAIRVANAVLPHMRKQKSGRILHTSSIVGRVPTPYMGFYAASKHALEAYAEALDQEVRNFGIRSILIEPSFMKTAITAHDFKVDRPQADYQVAREKAERYVEKGIANSPSADMVAIKAVEVAELANPKARYLVGRDAAILWNLRKFAPVSVFDKLVRSQMKLD
nr:short chain dehydrogenase [uncultured organism]